MPVVARAAHAPDRGRWKRKDKHKMLRFLELTVCCLLTMSISETAYGLYHCMQRCSVRHAYIASELDEKGGQAVVVATGQKKFSVTLPSTNLHQRNNMLSSGDEESNMDIEIFYNYSENLSTWDLKRPSRRIDEVDVDPNYIWNVTLYEDISTFLDCFIFTLSSGQHTEIKPPDIGKKYLKDYDRMFDSVLLVSQF